MKKKLFLTVCMMVLLCCLFAISVSAKHEYTPLTDDALTNLDVKITLTNGTSEFNATVKFKDLFNYTLTDKTETVAYSLKLSSVKSTVNVNGTDYTLKDSMTGIYIPDGVTHLNDGFLKSYSTMTKISVPDSVEWWGDSVFGYSGTISFIDENGNTDNYLPENLTVIGTKADGTGNSHFLSGCKLTNSVLVFPEGLTNFAASYSFNDNFTQSTGSMKLIFLGKMTYVKITDFPINSVKLNVYFVKNSASEAKILAGGTEVNQVETRIVNDKWAYAYRNSITGNDVSTVVNNAGKTLTIDTKNNDPNSTSSAGTYQEKDWYYQSGQAPVINFCSGEKILLFRNGSFGWKVYRSEIIKDDNVHPLDDGGKTVEPSCLIGGGTRLSCAFCGAFMSLKDQTAEPLGHEYTEDDLVSSTALGCLQDETKTYKCQRCNEQFTVIVEEAHGHDMSVVTYPLEATYTSLGWKRIDCSVCDYYTEYEYRLDPAGATMTVIMDDGTRLSVVASLIFNSTFNEESQNASITGLKDSFNHDEKTYNTSDINTIIVPFGFNHVGYGFSNSSDVEVYDFSLTNSLILGNGAFRDNGYVEKVILGDKTTPLTDAFRAPAKLSSIVIADGATVTFPISHHCFTDDTYKIQEIIIGKGANVNFAISDFVRSGMRASIKRIIIGEGATVNFGANSFKNLEAVEEFTIGEGSNITFGASSFYGSNIPSLIIPNTATVTFAGDGAFKNCTSLKSVYFPASITEIRKETFCDCSALESVVLMGVTKIGDSAFKATSNVALTIYAHATGDLSFGSNALANRSNVILYTNSKNITSLSNATWTVYSGLAHVQTPHTEAETCFENGYIGYKTDCPCGQVVYGVTYTVYTNENTEGVSSTLDNITVIDEFDGHDLAVSVTYANGYDKNGVKHQICLRFCGATFEDVSLNPIVTHKGYSFKENGDGALGLQSGFHLDLDALNEYNLYNDDLVLGLAILNPKYLGESFFDGQNLNCEKGFLQVDIDVFTYSEISCMINFPENTNLAGLELSIFAYVFDGDDMQLVQKQYTVGEKAPVVSKVTKTDGVLHTVNLTTVVTPVALPESIKEYEIPTV